MLHKLLLDFQAEPRFEKLREDLSAAHLVDDGHLWLASDEVPSLERLTWDGAQFGAHASFDVTAFFDLPAGPEGEIDVEGLCTAGDYLWLVGSHSRKIKKPKDELSDRKNIRRLTGAETQTEPNRYLLGRIPLVDGRLVASAADPRRPGETLVAAALTFEDEGNLLVKALKDDPHIGPYVAARLPGKANGLDVEGLDVWGERLLLGLRGPVLLDWALLIEIEPKEKNDGVLRLKKIGPKDRPYRKHFVNLHGLGIRDLCRVGDDLLILAGPTQFLDGPAQVFRLRGADRLDDDVMHRPELLFDVPFGVGTDHAEAITLATRLTGQPSLLVIYDAPDATRLKQPNGVFADLFALPTTI